MTDLYKMFETNVSRETEGFIYNLTPEIRFVLARAGGSNTKFSKLVEAKFRPYRRQIDNNTMSNDLAEDIMKQVFAEVIVLDWEGVKDKNGKNMPCNPGNVVKLFTDLPDLFKELQAEASRMSNFQNESIEEDVKN